MPWPPSAEYLQGFEGIKPEESEKCLNVVLFGKEDIENVRVNRLVLSIGQDICRGATNGK